VDPHYLERRRLRKTARWGLLWALGVGAVISGAYFGWNFGLVAGGFTGLVVATVMVTVMYVCLVFSIAELTAALPHAGGFYSFTRNAFGPTAGYICGVTDTIEYVLTPAVIVVGIGGYLHALWPAVPPAAWWVLSYVLFVAVNLRGVSLTLRVGLVITVLAVAVLVVFYVGALATGAFRIDLLSNVPPDAGRSATWLPKGAWGVFAALPFAIWFYLAIEQLPLAAEETHDVVVDMPKALLLSIATLLVLSFLTLVLNTGVGGGAAAMGASAAPLGDGFRAVFGDGATTAVLTLVALAGLVASFHGTVYAYGRVLFALSRAGYFPRWISLTNTHGAPAPALLLGAAVGLACAVAIELAGKGAVGAALLNMAVFGAVISYTMVLASYVRLRLARPDLPRPYRSPLGVPGAVTGAALSLVALAACFSIPDLRAAVWGVALFLAVAVVYFLVYSRHRLVAQAPEEQVALGGHDAPPAAPHP
jgi:ethanolamine permease